MKPSAHNDIELLRHSDAGLRSALQQRYADVPPLPEGFAERFMANLPSDSGSAPQPARRRRLWPYVAASLAAAALLTVAFFVPREPERPLLPAAAEGVAEACDAVSTTAIEGNEAVAVCTPAPAMTLARVSAIAPVTGAVPVLAADDVSVSATDVVPASAADIEETAVADIAAGDTSAAEAPAGTDFYVRRDLLADNVRDNNTATSSPHTEPLLTMAVHIGTGGGLGSGSTADMVYQENRSMDASMKSANYYFTMGNGYTYDYGQDENDEADDDGEEQDAAKRLQKEPLRSREANSIDHKQPFSIGLTLEWAFAKRWALESGLTYTRLNSSFVQSTTASYTRQAQSIHYLGIPVRLHARLFNNRRWNVYAAAGGSVELPVAATLTSLQTGPGHEGRYRSSHIAAPVQYSLNAGVGVQFRLTPRVGVYAEPSVQWFVPDGGDIETYRTEHPLHFVPAFGLRWNL